MNDQDRMIKAIERDARETAGYTGRARLSPKVLAAMRAVRREAFVPAALAAEAYLNRPLRIGHGQTISQPFIVALMTDLLDLEPHGNVLEIGTGSGYQAAVLAGLSDRACSVESVPELAERAHQVLARETGGKVALRCGDGRLGWPERAPFDAIIVTAAGPGVPPALVEQLAPGGRMVIPVGKQGGEQELRVISKDASGGVVSHAILPVAFVPLTGGEKG
jgi:protein-L-isoaspartate(D-aspartate) O-methyltransferase